MTHTLHRSGSFESLLNDYIVVAKAANGINSDGAKMKLSIFMKSAIEHGAINGGHGRGGCVYSHSLEHVLEKITDHSTVTVVFDDQSKMFNLIDFLIEKDLGLSIVISGIAETVNDYCKHKGIVPHSIKHSLGIFGKLSFAEDKILNITTMCGHSLIGIPLVKKLTESVISGKITAEEASLDMAKICKCGIFNPKRGEQLIQELIKEKR